MATQTLSFLNDRAALLLARAHTARARTRMHDLTRPELRLGPGFSLWLSRSLSLSLSPFYTRNVKQQRPVTSQLNASLIHSLRCAAAVVLCCRWRCCRRVDVRG